ncbi:MAG TPA: response regulator [Chloroflexi bacterium]|jgi:excisionase family DNA binding protein|nr:response regulator [Chloroflexota bacterium]
MLNKPLTTGEVARLCHVSAVAIWKWIKKGKLPAYRLPGGHYRIEPGSLLAFAKKHNITLNADLMPGGERRILVVDDEPTVIEIVTRALQTLGEHIILASATDGFEAGLQMATFRPHLLILDLMMPQVNGFEVCRRIREDPALAHARILIITAFGSHENLRRILEIGADDFLHKPLDIDRLTEKVEALLYNDATPARATEPSGEGVGR